MSDDAPPDHEDALRVRRVVFTINNPTEEDKPSFDPTLFRYLVYQLEKGQSGTPHFQGYAEFFKALRFNRIKRLLPRAHLERAFGSSSQCTTYCTKSAGRLSDPVVLGQPAQPGSRTDVQQLVALASTGKRKREALEMCPAAYFRMYRSYAHVQSLFPPPPVSRLVTLLVGPPGTGKTRYVVDNYEDLYVHPVSGSGLWFDGYDGHPVALIDDFHGQFPLDEALRVFDRYVILLPTKGGHVWWSPTKVFVTANYLPDEWYDYTDRELKRRAMYRRFHEIIHFPRDT